MPTPDKVYCFMLADGRLVSTTASREEALGWLPHRKVGEAVAEYGLVKEAKKERGKGEEAH